jgi:hypothetical protein
MDDLSAHTNLGPWIISAIALLQVWVIEAWKRVRRAKLDWYESQNIEVGFSTFGPTLGLLGTLGVRHKDFLVRSISTTIIRQADRMTRSFQWHTFRSQKVNVGKDEPVSTELVSSFLLSPQAPFKFNIFFQDAAYVADVNPKATAMVTAWTKFISDRGAPPQGNAALEQAFEDFTATGAHLDFYSALDRSFYWRAGEYTLQVHVAGIDGKSRTLREFAFTIAPDDERNLRLNVIAIQRILCDARLAGHFNFAFPKYRTADPGGAAQP